MTKLFGVDIAKELNKAMGKGLLPGQLLKVTAGTRSITEPTAGTNPTTRTFGFRGIVEDYADSEFDGTNIVRGDRRILVLGGSLPTNTFPEAEDKITIEGRTYCIKGIPKRDPAAATYLCQGRGT